MKTQPLSPHDRSAAFTPLHATHTPVGRMVRTPHRGQTVKRAGARAPVWSAVAVLLLAAAWSAAAQVHTQTIALRPGWNAIWVEVEPTNNAIGVVFRHLPEVEAVWAYFEKGSTADFVQDVNELPWNNPRWRRYFPPPSPKVVLNNLHTLDVNRAYLVKATNAATLILTGRPSVRPATWVPDALNFRGFPIDPVQPPSFDAFFAPAAAHAGQPVYRLTPGGVWEMVAGTTVGAGAAPVWVPGTSLMKSGEAYWVYSRGASDYTAPLRLELEGGDGLDYENTLTEQAFELRNLSSNDAVVSIAGLAGGVEVQGKMPLAYYRVDTTAGSNWVTFESPHVAALAATNTLSRRLAILRSAWNATTYEAVLSIADGLGTRYLCPLSASKLARTGAGSEDAHTGLWVGNAVLNAVSEAQAFAGTGTETTPTLAANGNGSEFNLRLLVHVDTNGTSRLLKQILQLWRDGAYVTNPTNGLLEVDTNNPGRFVLLTDDTRIADFQGASQRDGEPVGRRISCIGFDFEDELGQPANTRRMTGAFALRGALTNQFTLGYDFATNPFKHFRHPDHDNKNITTTGETTDKQEAPNITRTVELHFSPQAPPGETVPDYGYSVIAGTYREVLRGLHRRDLVVSGPFRLIRVSVIGELNPAKSNP